MTSTNRKPCMLMILDGWGINDSHEGNAVFMADTPVLDRLLNEYPHTRLQCSGKSVGLPPGIMGNSEVGHLNIGAGRVVYQSLMRIDESIKNGSFFENKNLCSAMSVMSHSRLHIMGLVSDGGVHSQMTHLLALLDMARQNGLENVYVHAVLDGRDTPPTSGSGYIDKVRKHMDKHRFGTIASICGRYYAMDRDKRWNRIEKAYRLYTLGEGVPETDPAVAVENAYKRGETDEFVKPIIMTDTDGGQPAIVRDGDGIIFFNFRADRAREITRAFTDSEFDEFNRVIIPKLCQYTTMTGYDESFINLPTAFPPVHLAAIIGEIVVTRGFVNSALPKRKNMRM